MNDYLSQFIENFKEFKLKKLHGMEYKYGNNGKLKKSRSEKLFKLEAETKNYEHMLMNMSEEHLKFKNRHAQVTDHNYVLELRQKVEESKSQINQYQKILREMQDTQFKREKKMDQVITVGEPDAMKETQEKLKEIIVLNKRQKEYENKIQFQIETEGVLDQNILDLEKRVEILEKQAKNQGLNLNQNDAYTDQIISNKLAEIKKKKITKNAINTIQKKFFTKFSEQKIILENILSNHNQFSSTFVPNKNVSLNTNKAELKLIDTNSYPLMVELCNTIEQLKDSMPVISSKLQWNTSDQFRPRAISTDSKSKQIKKIKAMYSRNVDAVNSAYRNNELENNINSKSMSSINPRPKLGSKRYLDSSKNESIVMDAKVNSSIKLK